MPGLVGDRESADRTWLVRTFTFLAVVFGLAFAAITPPLNVPDEGDHLYGAYRASLGVVRPNAPNGPPGGWLPYRIIRLHRAFAEFQTPRAGLWPAQVATALNEAETTGRRGRFLEFHNPYSPLTYAPAGVALALGRAVDLPLWGLFYAGRIANLLFWIVCVRWALRLTPVLPEVLWLVALSPVALFLAGSYSADSVTNAIAWLYTAAVLRIAFGPGTSLDRFSVAAIAGLAAVLGLLKYAYLPLVGLCFLIPCAKATSVRAWRLAMFATVGAALATFATWVYLARDAGIDPRLGAYVAEARPWAGLVADPLAFLLRLARTTVLEAHAYTIQLVGHLGLLDTRLSYWIIGFYPAAFLVLGLVSNRSDVQVRFSQRALPLVLLVIVYVGIQAVAWQRWSSGEGDVIRGFQGRYVLPLLPAAALALPQNRFTPSLRAHRLLRLGIFVGVVASLWVSSATLLRRYFTPQLDWHLFPGQLEVVVQALRS